MKTAMDPSVTLFLADEAATGVLGRRLAGLARSGDVLALTGPLGSGKTTLVRAFIRALTDEREEVPSPTFTLVQLYEAETAMLWHFDLYRLDKPDDAYELGIEEALAEGITLIEWPERLGGLLPRRRLDVVLEIAGDQRVAVVTSRRQWDERLAGLES